MNRTEKMETCNVFFGKLCDILSETHEVMSSSNNDESAYLVPNGTTEQVTYYSKPYKSFRVSDHWNWYANLKKNDNERYVQCLSVDLPWSKKRPSPCKASKPIVGYQVAMIGDDGKYHCVYGEKYDRKTKTWSWKEADPTEVAKLVG